MRVATTKRAPTGAAVRRHGHDIVGAAHAARADRIRSQSGAARTEWLGGERHASGDTSGGIVSHFHSVSTSAPIATSPPTVAEGKAGTAYRQSFAASGGPAPYPFTLATGALPPGLPLTTAGLFNGTPTVEGFYSFTI